MKKFLNVHQLSQESILSLVEQAMGLLVAVQQRKVKPVLTGVNLCHLFYEPSTRTHRSFEVGAKMLGANVTNVNVENSSEKKGERALDTVLTLESLFHHAIIIRHPNYAFVQEAAKALDSQTVLVNAGGGDSHHPTQALLDVMTMLQSMGGADQLAKLQDASIAIIGDAHYSRVAKSLIHCLGVMGVKDLRIFGPRLPSDQVANGVVSYADQTTISYPSSKEQAVEDAKFVVGIRIQDERQAITTQQQHDYVQAYRTDAQLMTQAHPDAKFMHPGPAVVGLDTAADLHDHHPASLLRKQVSNGVAMRMALLTQMLHQ